MTASAASARMELSEIPMIQHILAFTLARAGGRLVSGNVPLDR